MLTNRVVRVPFEITMDHVRSLEVGERSEGVHVSDVIRDMAVILKILDRKWVERDMHPMTILLGCAFEDKIVQLHPEIVFHPGEVSKDGISMSPDGITVLGGDVGITGLGGVEDGAHYYRVSEFKYTRKSNRDFAKKLQYEDKKVWMWLRQIQAYCYAMETGLGLLHVAFANGDYTFHGDGEGDPQYEIYRMKYTAKELKENWDMLRRHAERMRLRK